MDDKGLDYTQILGKELSRFALHTNLDCINSLEDSLRCEMLDGLQIPKEHKDDVMHFVYKFFIEYRKRLFGSYR